MSAFPAINAVLLAATLLLAGFSGSCGVSIVHPSSLVSSRAQLIVGERAERADAPNSSDIGGISLVEVGKPIRIVRGGSAGSAAPGKGGPKHETDDKCGTTHKVHSGSDKWEACPKSCPFYAQNRQDDDFCTFACVTEPDCAKMHPKTPIGDAKLGVCRSCVVEGCQECDYSVTTDKCAKCQRFYKLKDGQCYFVLGGAWTTYAFYGILAILAIVALWFLDLVIRPVYNQTGLDHGMKVRYASMLRQEANQDGVREIWPWYTNLCKRADVAGPGMMLHFTFQASMIVWAAFVAIVWMCLAQFVDEALWILGTRSFGTPRMNCILVAWGYETQQRLMWTKVLFLYIVWFGTFFMCMGYSIYQLRAFQNADYKLKTMKDFVAVAVGVEDLSGEDEVEKSLKKAVEDAVGVEIVGVSVAWNYQDDEEAVNQVLHEEMAEKVMAEIGDVPTEQPDMPFHRRYLVAAEASVFCGGEEEEGHESEEKKRIREFTSDIVKGLKAMKTSSRAFVVFQTQDDKEKACEMQKFNFQGREIELEEVEAEPETVNWQNFGHDSYSAQVAKVVQGFGWIALACAVWGLVFYAPYAYYVLTFNYENGRQPGFAVGMTFSMIVVVGNVIMYEVCARISDNVGFRFRDQREACYMILYTIACMFNVGLDFITTYRTAESVMEGLGFRTYFGVPLEDVEGFTAKFETYGMQRSLAENTYNYAFPSTFLIPFLLEPLPAFLIPLLQGRLVVKSHVSIQGQEAEENLGMVPMDMGRYADLLLNGILGILIFYFPGGYTWRLFWGMAASHVYIYIFDHFRILYGIPACVYAGYDVEWWAQAMMAPINGIVAACLVFKSNCEPGYHCITGPPLTLSCCLGWVVATAFHLFCLIKIVPLFGMDPPEEEPEELKNMTFKDKASTAACSWFTANPVHCLRSKYIYEDNPPCGHWVLGKERFLKANPAIGCFYEEGAAKKS